MTNTQSITSDTFASSRVFVLAGPREKFTENEFVHLKRYLETGGSLLVLLGEGGEKRQVFKITSRGRRKRVHRVHNCASNTCLNGNFHKLSEMKRILKIDQKLTELEAKT